MKSFLLSIILILAFPVNALAMTCTAGSSSYATIQSAIDDVACDEVKVPDGVYREHLNIARDVSIVGGSRDTTIIDASGATGVAVYVSLVASVSISNLAVTKGTGGPVASAVESRGNLSLQNVWVYDNGGSNSAVFSGGSNIQIKGSVIEDNSGTGLHISAGNNHRIQDSDVRRNDSTGIYLKYAGNVSIISTRVHLNGMSGLIASDANGGRSRTILTINDSDISGNDFGGIRIYEGAQAVISESIVSKNRAIHPSGDCMHIRGGGITNQGNMVISKSSVIQNDSDVAGGGVYNTGILVINDSLVVENRVSSLSSCEVLGGGGIYNGEDYSGVGSLIILRSGVNKNQSEKHGGGIYSAENQMLKLINTTISSNVAEKKGGGIYFTKGGSLMHVSIFDNKAKAGGGLYPKRDNVTQQWPGISFKNTAIAKNSPVDCRGKGLVSNGHNLDGDGSCNLDVLNNDIPSTDPRVTPLQSDGYHVPLKCNSKLVDRADVTNIHKDQRKLLRPVAACVALEKVPDIGAIEYHPELDN